MLKGLLTAVTSNTLHIHGQALLLVSRGLVAALFRSANCTHLKQVSQAY